MRNTARNATRPTTYVATPAARNHAVAALAGSSYLTTASFIPAASTMIPPSTGRNAYPKAKSASHGFCVSGAASSARSARSSSPSKYNHHNAAASASPSTAVTASPVDRSCPCTPIPTATTDSPNAISTISPWRSTKCLARMRNPPTAVTTGEAQCKTNAPDQSVHCTPPLVKPATRMSAAVIVLNGPSRNMARTALS